MRHFKNILIILLFLNLLSSIIIYKSLPEPIAQYKICKEYDYLEESLNIQLYNESEELNDPILFYGNDSSKTVNVFNKINDKVLIFRFSGEMCNSCLDSWINMIKTNFADFAENKRILLIGIHLNPRVKESYYGKQMLSYKEGDFGLPLEKTDIPFFFVIDKERVSKMVFVPNLDYPGLTEMYLKNVKKRYFSEDEK